MDQQLEEAKTQNEPGTEPKPPSRSRHLMCRTALWGIAGFLACAYFAWISFQHVLRNEYDWTHDVWTALTYIVWVLLLCGLAVETRCLRERLFFGVLVVNFAAGFGLTLWRTVPLAQVRTARLGTGALWALAALLSLTTLGRGNAAGVGRGRP